MDFTFLDKCFQAIRPETWKQMNEALVGQAVADEEIDPSIIRTDTTVVESNIHWPTDSSLLWDTTNNSVLVCCQALTSFAIPLAVGLEWRISSVTRGGTWAS